MKKFLKFSTILLIIVSSAFLINFYGSRPSAQAAFSWPTTQHFPSVKYAGYITRSDTNYIVPGTNTTIRDWEAAHYDFIPSGKRYTEYRQTNPTVPLTYYSLMRYELWHDGDKWAYMRNYAKDHNFSFDDFFVHFAEDSDMTGNFVDGSQPDKFFYVYDNIYNISNNAYSGTNSWSFGKANGNTLAIGYFDKFDEINFNFTTAAGSGFDGIWEYSGGNDSTRNVSTWKALAVISDSTNKMTSSGQVKFSPPSDWTIGMVNNSHFDQAEAQEYFIRFRITNAVTQYPRGVGKGIFGASFYVPDATNKIAHIYGWDENADKNNDDYLDATEWPNRAANKNARFKWWSRLPGRDFMPPHSFKINPGGPYEDVEAQLAYETVTTSASNGINWDGIYWDESWTGAFYGWGEGPTTGGATLEYTDPATRNTQYQADLVNAFNLTRARLEPINKLVGGNLASAFGLSSRQSIEDSFDYILNELSLYASSDVPVILAREAATTRVNNLGKRLIVQGQISYADYMAGGGAGSGGYDTPSFERAKLLNFTNYLMYQNPNLDYFSNWIGDWYASGSVTDPRPVKYFTAAAIADFGRPTNQIPTPVGGTQYPKQGTNTSNIFRFATGQVPDYTSRTYYVLGRDYSKALVLTKPLPSGYSDSEKESTRAWSDATYTTHQLPQLPDNPSGRYYQVNYDGSISAMPITSINLRNGEGTILIKESALTGMVISKSADKLRAQPGETLTYTLTYRNGINQSNNATISDNIPSGVTFISATPSIQPDASGKLTWQLGNKNPGDTGTIGFQVRIN